MEFDSLRKIRVNKIKTLPKDVMSYSLTSFCESNEYQDIDHSLYTLIGKFKQECIKEDNDLVYSFPFGKREWFGDSIESSVDCAKRELFEEFNMQISKEIYEQSKSTNLPQYIYRPGYILYIVYFPNEISIQFHTDSETMYVDLA